jgi:SAM-dependent methyltransferase
MSPLPERTHTERRRAESFGGVAEQYDAVRPSYPAELVDDLMALDPADVLDVGCGTGKAGRLLVACRFPVLGVEIDPQMADVARRHGLTVDIAPFETWDPRHRTFDLIICGQAWHWIDPALGVPKAAALLRRGGTIALFWNVNELDEPVQAALDEVYSRHAPELVDKAVTEPERPYADDLDSSGLFEPVVQRSYPWEHVYPRDEWLALIQTHSDHVVLPTEQRAALVAGVAEAIDGLGGSVVSHYRTRALFARVKPH